MITPSMSTEVQVQVGWAVMIFSGVSSGLLSSKSADSVLFGSTMPKFRAGPGVITMGGVPGGVDAEALSVVAPPDVCWSDAAPVASAVGVWDPRSQPMLPSAISEHDRLAVISRFDIFMRVRPVMESILREVMDSDARSGEFLAAEQSGRCPPVGIADKMVVVKAIEINCLGTPVAPNVSLNPDRPNPEPGSGELMVRTEASALNQLDLWVGRGLPGLDRSFPAISGSDGVGVVESVGPDVSQAWVGRRVVLNAAVPVLPTLEPDLQPAPPDIRMIGEHTTGTMAEFFVAPVANVLDIGEADPVQAAAFGLVHLTAWRMLVTRAGLRPGSTVLVTGIGGGVALACLGIARMLDCRVIVTSRSQEKLDRALELGADHGVLDDGSDFSRTVRGFTNRRGVDVCADSVGKAIHLSGIKSLARGGTYVTCGCTSGPDATTDLARVFWNQLSILGSTMGDMAEFREVLAHFAGGRLRPVIDSVHPPEACSAAYERLETSGQFGKVVIDWR